jgi:hypothetical protein
VRLFMLGQARPRLSARYMSQLRFLVQQVAVWSGQVDHFVNERPIGRNRIAPVLQQFISIATGHGGFRIKERKTGRKRAVAGVFSR